MTVPATTNRGRVYELLRQAGEAGVTDANLHAADIRLAGAHIESLRYEGHAIAYTLGRGPNGEPVRRYILSEDAWA